MMICSICGKNKPPYHFTKFTHMDDGDKWFFVHIERYPNGNPRNDVCWECNGGYRCQGCGNVRPASEFRVQGRYCKACKSTWRTPAKKHGNRDFNSIETRAMSALGDNVHGGLENAIP